MIQTFLKVEGVEVVSIYLPSLLTPGVLVEGRLLTRKLKQPDPKISEKQVYEVTSVMLIECNGTVGVTATLDLVTQ